MTGSQSSQYIFFTAFNLRGDILSVILWLMGQNPVCFAHHSISYTSRLQQMLRKHCLCDENPRMRRWGCVGVALSAERPWPPGITAPKTRKQKASLQKRRCGCVGKLFVGPRDNSELRGCLQPAALGTFQETVLGHTRLRTTRAFPVG